MVILTGIVLTACGGQTAPAAEANQPEEAVDEPTQLPELGETEEESVSAGIDQLDAVFSGMLENMTGYNKIYADGLLTEMVEDNPPFILDVRTTVEVEEQGHIEGAAHIPLSKLAQQIDLLPSTDTPIVTYCADGWRATIAMTALQGMGFEDVRALKVGFADWKEAGNPAVNGLPENAALSAAQLDSALVQAADAYLVGIKDHGMNYGVTNPGSLNQALSEHEDLVVIDVRRQEEVNSKGSIDASNYLHIPLKEFVFRRAEWPAQDVPVTVYCRIGHRSTIAMTILLSYGYSDVSSLSGGFGGWVEVGYPVVEYAAP